MFGDQSVSMGTGIIYAVSLHFLLLFFLFCGYHCFKKVMVAILSVAVKEDSHEHGRSDV